MVYGPRTRAQAGIGANGLGDESLGSMHGIRQTQAFGEIRSDCSGVGASRAMRMACVDAWRPEILKIASDGENVDGISGQMAAFHQHGMSAHFVEANRGAFHFFFVFRVDLERALIHGVTALHHIFGSECVCHARQSMLR